VSRATSVLRTSELRQELVLALVQPICNWDVGIFRPNKLVNLRMDHNQVTIMDPQQDWDVTWHEERNESQLRPSEANAGGQRTLVNSGTDACVQPPERSDSRKVRRRRRLQAQGAIHMKGGVFATAGRVRHLSPEMS
ncbi:unnamed protein product, partial [Durusdinium trenchii]